MTAVTPFPDLNQVLEELLQCVRGILGETLLGLYLQGSFAVGDFDRHSDCDFIAVIADELTEPQVAGLQAMHARIFQLDCDWAQHLEGSYFPQVVLRDYRQGHALLWYLDNGHSQLIQATHDNTIVVRLTLSRFGVTLSGPSPATLVDPIPVEAFRQEMLAHMRSWGAQILADPNQINNHFYQCFAVFHFCRLLHNLATGIPGSKRAATLWAQANLDSAWHSLIERAWQGRPVPELSVRRPADPVDLQQTLRFIRYALRLVDEQYPATHPTALGQKG